MNFILAFLLAVAPVFSKVAVEGTTAANSPIVTLPAGATYRFGAGTKWCDSVTTTAPTNVTVWYQSVSCKVGGVVTSDPAPNVVKELDVQEGAAVLTIPIVTAGVKSSATVPAIAPTTITKNCTGPSVTDAQGNLISLSLTCS